MPTLPKAPLSAVILLTLCSCQKVESAFPDGSTATRGRYAGIGLYSTDTTWREAAQAQDPKDPALARLADDDIVIVTADSQTGEIRQCGNLSGFCITMNPWQADGKTLPHLPLKLLNHRHEEHETEAASTAKP